MHVSSLAQAEGVKMYEEVPSANEMASMLFPKAQATVSKRPKMRSLSFDPIESAVQQPVEETAAAESVGIGLPIQFDFNAAEITNASRPYIDELGKMLSRDDLSNEKIVIEGHTDARGSSRYNQKLSLSRAEAVRHYLSYKYGIEKNRMEVSGEGEYKPLEGKDPNAAVNRRVEIHRF